MSRIFQPLLFLLARSTHEQMAKHIELLKADNEMLRKRVPLKHIHLSAEEKARLMKLGEAIGPAVRHLITVVHYTT